MVVELLKGIRPIFVGQSNRHNNIHILLDTGAECSVYTRSEGIFLQRFPDAKKLDFKASIGGFGSNRKLCTMYEIPEISIGGIKVFKLPVAIYPKERVISSEIILASCVFYYVPFKIDLEDAKLYLYPKRTGIYCMGKSIHIPECNENIFTGTYVLAQEEINE